MSTTQTQTSVPSGHGLVNWTNGTTHIDPLEPAGLWNNHKQSEITPLIGTTFEDVNLADVLRSPNCDDKIRDLAILISRRGLCVFRRQGNCTVADQKLLCRKLGQLTTRPATSDLWIHPVNQTKLPDGTLDGEVMSPSRDAAKKLYTRVSTLRVESMGRIWDPWNLYLDCLLWRQIPMYFLNCSKLFSPGRMQWLT